MRSRGAFLVISVLAGGALGCGDGTGPNEITFEATVSGDLSFTLSGTAVFGVETLQGQQAFLIGMFEGDPSSTNFDIIVIGRDDPARPGAGTFPIEAGDCATCTAEDFAGSYASSRSTESFGTFVSENGSFTLTTSTPDSLVGTFDFTVSAVFVVGLEADTLRLQGSFTAKPGDIPNIG